MKSRLGERQAEFPSVKVAGYDGELHDAHGAVEQLDVAPHVGDEPLGAGRRRDVRRARGARLCGVSH